MLFQYKMLKPYTQFLIWIKLWIKWIMLMCFIKHTHAHARVRSSTRTRTRMRTCTLALALERAHLCSSLLCGLANYHICICIKHIRNLRQIIPFSSYINYKVIVVLRYSPQWYHDPFTLPKRYVLINTMSNPRDCSKRFTLYSLTYLVKQSPHWSLCEAPVTSQLLYEDNFLKVRHGSTSSFNRSLAKCIVYRTKCELTCIVDCPTW